MKSLISITALFALTMSLAFAAVPVSDGQSNQSIDVIAFDVFQNTANRHADVEALDLTTLDVQLREYQTQTSFRSDVVDMPSGVAVSADAGVLVNGVADAINLSNTGNTA